MKDWFWLSLILLFAVVDVSAQETFLLKDASKNFDVKITVAKCEDDICEGASKVFLIKKNQTAAFQTIRMPNIYLELGENRKPTANLVELYGMNNSGVVFDDFNFDGVEDLAIRNGNEGGYGGPSYDILLYVKAGELFYKSPALTKLASENLGLFEVNKKTKTLETFTKSGCCWHQTTRYKIVSNRPVKIYIFTEDATCADGKWVVLTTENLVAAKWRKMTKKVLRKDYYKEN